ncbi:MAG TPA: mandelate racemase/muconate lactonizing enzyme family protein [Chloroflexota bacterium]|jgi:D-galactarolactone cycloisomerase|nr:mandelate racemase/muconate lactonizing enzyme family protein [Chloroflexota bacterium]
MKITAVDCHVLRAPLVNPFYYSQGYYPSREAVLVELRTDQDLSGWGQCSGAGAALPAIIRSQYAPRLLGRDPGEWQALWHTLGGLRGAHYGALSGLEMALLDLAGKAAGRPIHRLLGGALRDRVKVYATGLYRQERWDSFDAWREGLVAEALGYQAEGFALAKIKIGFVPRQDVALVRAVREAVGPQLDLAVDANCAWDAATAIWVGREIEGQRITWYEEPLAPDDLEGYREVRRAVAIPVSGGEGLAGLHPFRELIATRAVDIVQPDIIICGGFGAMQRIQTLADAFHVRLIPHCWGTALSLAASLHFLATVPDSPPSITPTEPLLEYDRSENPLREALLTEPLRQRGGYLPVPQGPGLGVEIDPQALARYRIGP